MPGFASRPYRRVLATQAVDLMSALPDALAALAIVAAIASLCWALEPSPAPHVGKYTLRVAEAK